MTSVIIQLDHRNKKRSIISKFFILLANLILQNSLMHSKILHLIYSMAMAVHYGIEAFKSRNENIFSCQCTCS